MLNATIGGGLLVAAWLGWIARQAYDEWRRM